MVGSSNREYTFVWVPRRDWGSSLLETHLQVHPHSCRPPHFGAKPLLSAAISAAPVNDHPLFVTKKRWPAIARARKACRPCGPLENLVFFDWITLFKSTKASNMAVNHFSQLFLRCMRTGTSSFHHFKGGTAGKRPLPELPLASTSASASQIAAFSSSESSLLNESDKYRT